MQELTQLKKNHIWHEGGKIKGEKGGKKKDRMEGHNSALKCTVFRKTETHWTRDPRCSAGRGSAPRTAAAELSPASAVSAPSDSSWNTGRSRTLKSHITCQRCDTAAAHQQVDLWIINQGSLRTATAQQDSLQFTPPVE